MEVAEKGKDTYLVTIGIERLHMEEDAGKLVHAGKTACGIHHSLVDYNRAGVAWRRSSASRICAGGGR